MGIAVISILLFHFAEDCRIYSYNYDGIIKFYKSLIGSAGVDLFLLLSGFGLYYSWKKNSNYKEFMSKRVKKIVIPYLIIAISAFIIRDVFIKNLGFMSVLKGITFYTYLTTGDNWFWYILMILICYSIYPWIFNIVEENKTKTQTYTSMISTVTFITVLALLLKSSNPKIFSYTNIMLLRFPVFVLGAFLGRASYEKRVMGKELLAFLILSIVMLPLRETNNIIMLRYSNAFILLAIILIIIFVLEWLDNHKIKFGFFKKILEWLGKYSLEIYLGHVAVRNILINLGYYTCRIRYFLLEVVITIVISIIVKKLADLINNIFEKISTNKKLAK